MAFLENDWSNAKTSESGTGSAERITSERGDHRGDDVSGPRRVGSIGPGYSWVFLGIPGYSSLYPACDRGRIMKEKRVAPTRHPLELNERAVHIVLALQWANLRIRTSSRESPDNLDRGVSHCTPRSGRRRSRRPSVRVSWANGQLNERGLARRTVSSAWRTSW